MKKLLIVLLLLLSNTVKADYITPSLNDLILKADKILYGEIQCVDESVIEVKVYGSINHDSESITILKFKEWNCGKRWNEYRVGQTSLFFLKYRHGGYRPMGGGNEGELPIVRSKVYVHTSSISPMGDTPLFERSSLTIKNFGYNNPFEGYVMKLKDFWEATGIIKKCFKYDLNTTGKSKNIKQLCPGHAYESIAEHNKILSWALTELNI
ncbi:hypothetical protein [uncultured Eudoraea sp.]|uniref:hypothetical protein n=1 Tax=uncultured Eudoraea sp. TaxID=1035614 RepID=UPI002627B348|nr:hypothetical protein [uncultured Eudoraea sp.]